MRVVAGTLRGRTLRAPSGAGTRPTSALVRGSLFASLEVRFGERATPTGRAEMRVLDLYAGSGALGIEALSRGAAQACFVETERRALVALGANLHALGLEARACVVRQPVVEFLKRPTGESFGLVLADPPYALGAAHLLPLLTTGAWLGAGGICAIEHSTREELPERSGILDRIWRRVHGATAISVYAVRPDRG